MPPNERLAVHASDRDQTPLIASHRNIPQPELGVRQKCRIKKKRAPNGLPGSGSAEPPRLTCPAPLHGFFHVLWQGSPARIVLLGLAPLGSLHKKPVVEAFVVGANPRCPAGVYIEPYRLFDRSHT
jgi:hypothetical protein